MPFSYIINMINDIILELYSKDPIKYLIDNINILMKDLDNLVKDYNMMLRIELKSNEDTKYFLDRSYGLSDLLAVYYVSLAIMTESDEGFDYAYKQIKRYLVKGTYNGNILESDCYRTYIRSIHKYIEDSMLTYNPISAGSFNMPANYRVSPQVERTILKMDKVLEKYRGIIFIDQENEMDNDFLYTFPKSFHIRSFAYALEVMRDDSQVGLIEGILRAKGYVNKQDW